MRKIEAFKGDDGHVYETRAECARADYERAVEMYRKAHEAFDEVADYVSPPRHRIRTALRQLYARLRAVEACMKDLDFHDEDPTDPERIAKAKNEEQRAAVAIMVAVRNFCTATANSSGDNNET